MYPFDSTDKSDKPKPPAMVSRYIASETNVNALRDLCKTWRIEGEFWDFDSTLGFLATPGCMVYFYPLDSDPHKWAGVIMARRLMDTCEILFIYVRSECRSKGLAAQLMQTLITDLQDLAMPLKLHLEVKKSNTVAQHLYEKQGLTQISVRKKYYVSGEDALIYQREF